MKPWDLPTEMHGEAFVCQYLFWKMNSQLQFGKFPDALSDISKFLVWDNFQDTVSFPLH